MGASGPKLPKKQKKKTPNHQFSVFVTQFIASVLCINSVYIPLSFYPAPACLLSLPVSVYLHRLQFTNTAGWCDLPELPD